MISIKSTSCINGFKKILRMSKFCGIIPLDEQCHLRPVLTLVTTVIYLSLFAFISSWFWLHYLDLVNSDINNLLTFFRNCCCTVSLILISYRFTYKRHVLRAAMWSLTAIDKALLAGNLKWDWSIHPIMFGGNFIAVTASLIFHLIWKGSQVCPLFLIFYTHLVLMMLGIAQFCTFLNFIRYCLKQIGYCKNPEHYPKLYSCIESVSLVINDIYGQGIICIIVALYLGILHHLYNLFSFLDLSLTLKWNNLLMVTTYTIILLQIILTCQKLAMQVREFNMNLYEEQKYCRKLLCSEELKFHFETMEEFEFTAYHFFPVNISLIGSMILSGTTYLVTLLQFTPSGIQKSQ